MAGASSNTVFFDIECAGDKSVFALGAVNGKQPPLVARNAAEVTRCLTKFRAWIDSADYICGHNIIAHDIPQLEKRGFNHFPKEKLLDTLYLSPLAFPKKPFHELVKEGKIASDSRNDPVLDSSNCAKLFEDCCSAFEVREAIDVEIFYQAFELSGHEGMARFFSGFLDEQIDVSVQGLIKRFQEANAGRCCLNSLVGLDGPESTLMLAYIHAWLGVAGGDSVLPYWVCHLLPELRPFLKDLRQNQCKDSSCSYCTEMHSPLRSINKYFGFAGFRPKPSLASDPNKSLQEVIISKGILDQPLMGILPTGGGKSVCFQLPAFHHYECTGALTIVISPLQSLMRDQVENLRKRTGILYTGALYGLLTPLERKQCLEKIRMGDIGLLYIAPEQLRSTAFRSAIKCREVAFWVFDEAHCLSKWGHDFRPDYVYAGKFIRELAQEQTVDIPPVLCLTATAKESVKNDILQFFKKELDQELILLDGGTERRNLNYRVWSVGSAEKLTRIHEVLSSYYGEPPELDGQDDQVAQTHDVNTHLGSVVIFCATRRHVEDLAAALSSKGWKVAAFHGGIGRDDATGDDGIQKKKEILDGFLQNRVRIIVATNAFGMGVDKPDIRYVIHADATGSLENYLQEAGRAGRDGEPADCILLYDKSDLETQFNLAALSKLDIRDIKGIWRTIFKAKPDSTGAITLSAGEIRDAVRSKFSFIGNADDLDETKIKTAVSQLEQQEFLERKENRARVFEARALVSDLESARNKIERLNVPIETQKIWMAVLGIFMSLKDHVCGDIDSFTTLPEIHAAFEELKLRRSAIKSINTFVFKIFNQMASPDVGLLKKDIFFSAFVSPKTSRHTYTHIRKLEDRLVDLLREEDPDANGRCLLHLTRANERLCREGMDCLPEYLERIIGFLKDDWQKLTRGIETFDFKRRNNKQYDLFINKGWETITKLIQTRAELCGEILNFIIGSGALGPNDRAQELVAFPETDLLDHLKSDMYSSFSKIPDLGEAVHYALLWLNENKVIELQNGKALITSAMTIYLKRAMDRGGRMRQYRASDYDALKCFYEEKKLQIHVVGKYARIGIEQEDGHVDFISDYFDLDGSEFVEKYFKGEEELLRLSTGIESYKDICESLNNKTQEGVVRADSYSNHMILAGPGSGKSRVIAHRCGWLLRGLRVHPGSIVVLCFNRHAALELRRRIWKLVGADARGVIIQTFHGLALRLLGRTMARLDKKAGGEPIHFDGIIPEAIKHLNGEKVLPGMEAEDFRRRLLGNLTHILVDEYQDITGEAYELVSLLAGKAQEGIENRLNILAVGDDDQSIYRFAGANVDFIRRFQKDFITKDGREEKPVTLHELVDNYRSTKNIIHSANLLIARNHDRMKQAAIRIDKIRIAYPEGGVLEGLDKVGKGKVQVLSVDGEAEQVVACIDELKRYLGLTDRHLLENCCIIGRTNKELIPMRLGLEKAGIGCRIVGSDPMPNLARIREVYSFLALMKEFESEIWTAEQLIQKLKQFLGSQLAEQPAGQILLQIAGEWYGETGGFEQPCSAIIDFYYDALHEEQRLGGQSSGVSICTAHKAKGMEFDCVFILDGGWNAGLSDSGRVEEERRLLYVAMTRASQNLVLFQRQDRPNPFLLEFSDERILNRRLQVIVPEANDLLTNVDAVELEELYISFSASLKPGSNILSALQRLQRGDPLKFIETTFKSKTVIEIHNQEGTCVTRLSQKGYEKWKPRLERIIRILTCGVHIRTNGDGNTTQDSAREFWEIPIFEIYWR